MPRIARLIEDNGVYHIITRGNDKKRLFRYSRDYIHFLKLTQDTIEKYGIAVYHYCLMSNHMHFLIRVNKAQDMPKFFQILFQRYANYFRKRYKHTGYLFQNRYKSYQITKDIYLLECARYIERNPVRANVVIDPGDYRWSSYLCYSKGNKDAIIKKLNPLYLSMASTNMDRQERYKAYLLEERLYEHIVDKGLRIQ